MDLITSLTTQAMNKALDGLAMRHKAIASNLANVDTPNYKRRDVAFEGALQSALKNMRSMGSPQREQASNDAMLPMRTTSSHHIASMNNAMNLNEVNPQIMQTTDLEYRYDGNSVDVETEMVQLAKNTQRYNAIANLESRNFKSIRSIITGGGG